MINQISKCADKDIDSVWGIIQSCSEWLSEKGFNHWKEYYSKDLVKQKLRESNIYSISIDHAIAGTVCLSTETPEYYTENDLKSYQDSRARALYVSMLAVLPNLHEQGIGSRLMIFAEEYAKESDIDFIRLDAYTPYKELNEFYLKRGYRFLQSNIDEDGDEMSFYEKEI